MHIRKFQIEDTTQVCELLNNELGKQISVDELSITVSDMLKSDDYAIFVAEQNKEIIGFIGVHFGLAFEITGKVMRIIALAVKECYQHRGIGTKLLEAAENCAIEYSASVIGVNSGLQRIIAHSFYEKHKFCKKGYSFTKNIELTE